MVTRKKKIFFFPDFHCSIFILIGTYRIATYVNAVLCDFLTASNAQRSFKKLCCCCSCWRGIKESKYVSMEQKILANEIRFKANKKCLQIFFSKSNKICYKRNKKCSWTKIALNQAESREFKVTKVFSRPYVAMYNLAWPWATYRDNLSKNSHNFKITISSRNICSFAAKSFMMVAIALFLGFRKFSLFFVE